MTPFEIRDTAKAFAKEIGEKAHVSVSISDGKHPAAAAVYTDWPMGSAEFRAEADDWAEMFDLLRERCAEHGEEYRRRMVRKMALEIIKVTAEQGCCTDATLRVTFTAADVERLGTDACRDADEIAGNGPFEIIRIQGVNAA